MKSVIYEELVNEIRNIAACRDLPSGDVTNLSDAAWLIESLQSRIEALEKDAARYRWLRESDWGCFELSWLRKVGACGLEGDGLDAAIDTAMQSEKGGV